MSIETNLDKLAIDEKNCILSFLPIKIQTSSVSGRELYGRFIDDSSHQVYRIFDRHIGSNLCGDGCELVIGAETMVVMCDGQDVVRHLEKFMNRKSLQFIAQPSVRLFVDTQFYTPETTSAYARKQYGDSIIEQLSKMRDMLNRRQIFGCKAQIHLDNLFLTTVLDSFFDKLADLCNFIDMTIVHNMMCLDYGTYQLSRISRWLQMLINLHPKVKVECRCSSYAYKSNIHIDLFEERPIVQLYNETSLRDFPYLYDAQSLKEGTLVQELQFASSDESYKLSFDGRIDNIFCTNEHNIINVKECLLQMMNRFGYPVNDTTRFEAAIEISPAVIMFIERNSLDEGEYYWLQYSKRSQLNVRILGVGHDHRFCLDIKFRKDF